MSWSAAPVAQSTVAMVRKSVSGSNLWGGAALGTSASAGSTAAASASSAGAADSDGEPRALGDVVVPLVLWDRPPRVTASSMHVAFLPRSQPSQNSNASSAGDRHIRRGEALQQHKYRLPRWGWLSKRQAWTKVGWRVQLQQHRSGHGGR